MADRAAGLRERLSSLARQLDQPLDLPLRASHTALAGEFEVDQHLNEPVSDAQTPYRRPLTVQLGTTKHNQIRTLSPF